MFKEFESNVVKAVTQVLTIWHQKLAEVGLQYKLIGPKRSFDEKSLLKESEIEIRFIEDENIIDVLEFHLIRGGKQAVSLAEVDEWLNENIGNIVKQKKAGYTEIS